jgi:hypothetical protein
MAAAPAVIPKQKAIARRARMADPVKSGGIVQILGIRGNGKSRTDHI